MVVNQTFLTEILKTLRVQGKKIVFTNGCFDLLHVGHIRLLQEASRLGGVLIVAVNSDQGVKRLKGEQRPIQSEVDRCEILDALRCVDFVTLFDEDTPLELIKLIRPDVLVKGGDWPVEKIVGSDFVRSYGGEARSLPLVEGRSTTRTIEKLGL